MGSMCLTSISFGHPASNSDSQGSEFHTLQRLSVFHNIGTTPPCVGNAFPCLGALDPMSIHSGLFLFNSSPKKWRGLWVKKPESLRIPYAENIRKASIFALIDTSVIISEHAKPNQRIQRCSSTQSSDSQSSFLGLSSSPSNPSFRVGSTGYCHRWTRYMIKTTSSRNAERRCIVGILMMNAKRSSMNVLQARYINTRHGRLATDLSL
mmetsp:Transcript_25405/g.40286  ORF Transcript_25405/g.40286 Transcript_25405/m.40286 type:complete len:208 (+) Transcript_25405:203-826(+)